MGILILWEVSIFVCVIWVFKYLIKFTREKFTNKTWNPRYYLFIFSTLFSFSPTSYTVTFQWSLPGRIGSSCWLLQLAKYEIIQVKLLNQLKLVWFLVARIYIHWSIKRVPDFCGNHRLFYFFFESRNNVKDPVVIWLTGGPGCSSSLGLFTENGPFTLSEDLSLARNEYSWNKVLIFSIIEKDS